MLLIRQISFRILNLEIKFGEYTQKMKKYFYLLAF